MSTDAAAASPLAENPIQRVFVLLLENRSFDHLFALSDIPGIAAATSSNTNTYGGTVYAFGDGAPTQMPADPGHEFTDVLEQLCGAGIRHAPGQPYPAIDNSGFVSNFATTRDEGTPALAAEAGEVMRGAD